MAPLDRPASIARLERSSIFHCLVKAGRLVAGSQPQTHSKRKTFDEARLYLTVASIAIATKIKSGLVMESLEFAHE